MPKQRTEELGSLSKSEKVSLNRLYSRGRAAYGSVQNLSRTNQDLVYKIGPPIRRFRRLQAFFKKLSMKSGVWTWLF